ncbi:MAG: hypothetical protein H6747_12560 [Deltaproteobacteria bacterium]|nr:hypothetical protein [Deltaproteobacteria bacterium]
MQNTSIFRRGAVALLAALLLGCGSEEGAGTGGTGAAVGCTADADCAALEDGNACNGTLRCDATLGVCAVDPTSIKICDTSADTACSATACDPIDGTCKAKAAAAGTSCSDGDNCTLGDQCEAGSCKPGPNSCECNADSDCTDDGDLCNGTPYCDKAGFPFRCVVNPATVVKCDPSASTCQSNQCEPKSGKCAPTPVNEGEACNDGDACTAGDACKDGACEGATEICACASDSDCPDLDGDLCNGVRYCDKTDGKGVCKDNPATVVECSSDADTDCRKNTCDKLLGACFLKPVGDKEQCDDGDPCTKGEICVGGACTAGTDTCKCSADADCADKDDGDLCNGTMFCNLQSGLCQVNPATIVTCPTVDDSACSKNVCIPKTGKCEPKPRAEVKQVGCQAVDLGGGFVAQFCLFQPKKDGEAADPGPFVCEDGNACTKGDVCDGSNCKSGPKTCECAADADCAGLEDGNLCNGTMFCDPASQKCVVNPKTIVACPSVDDTTCTKNTCQPKTGVCQPQPVAPGVKCDDGDACTAGDVCKLGTCTPGTYACECQTDADCSSKDDGNLCNGVKFCDKSGSKPLCKDLPGSTVYCKTTDDTDCLKAQCLPKTGACALQPVGNGASCDDGKTCTVAEVCTSGKCGGGKANACDDGDKCTIDSCDEKQGCTHTAKSCDDGNACTSDGCDATTGNCKAPVNAAKGTLCNADGNGCTVGDACDGKGACQAGGPVVCKEPENPCQKAICVDKGGTDYSCSVGQQPDGTGCDAEGACQIGAVCKSGTCGKPKFDAIDVAGPIKDGVPTTQFENVYALTAMPDGDIVVGGVWRASTKTPATSNQALVRRWDPAGTVQRWQATYAGSVAHPNTRVFGVAAVGDEVVAGADAATSGNKRYIDLRRFDAAGKALWTTSVVSTLPLAGVALAAHDSGKVALLGGETVNKSGKYFDNVAVRFFDGNGKAIGVPYAKNLGTVYNGLKLGRGGVQWTASNKVSTYVDFTMTGYSSGQTHGGAFAAIIGESGTAVEEGGLEPKYAPYDENPSAGQAAAQIQLTLGSGRLFRTRLRASLKGKTEGLIEATDSKGANPQRYDRFYDGEPAVALPLGKDRVVMAGPLSKGNGVYLIVTDHRGNEVWGWSRSTGRFGGIAVDGERRVLLGTNLDGSSFASLGKVLRFSIFGHQSCGEAASCYGKTSASCDDDDACTVDSCDGKTGCTHQAAPSLSCDVANGCSQRATCDANGACVPGEEGRMFTLPTYLVTTSVPPAFVQSGGSGDSICFMARQSSWVDPRNYCVATDEVGPAPPLTMGASSGCAGSLPALDPNTEDFADATVGGKVGCVRWGRKGYVYNGKTSYRAIFSRRGNTTWDKQACGTTSCSAIPTAMHPTPGGSTWTVMYEDYPSQGKIGPLKAVRYTTGGGAGGIAQHTRYNNTETYRASAARKDDGVLLVTRRKVGSFYQGWIGAFASNGSTLYSIYASHSSRSLSANAVAPLEDGGAITVGAAEPSSGLDSSWVWRVNGTGKTLWSKVASSPDGINLTSVIPLGTHIATAGLLTIDPLTRKTFVGGLRYDNGSFAFQRSFGTPINQNTSIAGLSDGGLAIGTIVKPNSSSVLAVVRTDAWGHPSCSAAGKCSSKSLADCDDGNTCLYNGCNAANGQCSAEKLVSTAPCGTSGVCTTAGTCSE